MTRRASALLLAGLLLVTGGAVAAGLRLRQGAPLVLAALERWLPGEIAAARARLGLWPLQLTLEGVTATLPAAAAPYFETRRLVVPIDPLPLVLGRVATGAATLVEPRLALRLEDGWWEGAPSPRPRSGLPASRTPAGRPEPGRGGLPLTLPTTVALEGGRLELAGQGRAVVIDRITGSLVAAPDGLRFVGALADPPARLAGRLRPLVPAMELEATVSDFRSPHLGLDGPIDLALRAVGRSTLEARLDFTRAELTLPGLLAKARGEPGLLTARLEGDRGVAVKALVFRLGPFELEGDAHLAPDRMALTLRTAGFPLDRLSPEVAGRPVELRGEVTGSVGVEVQDQGADLRGRLAVSDGGVRLPGGRGPEVGGLDGQLRLEGTVRAQLSLRWRGLTWPEFRRSARGHGVLTLEHGWLQVPLPERSPAPTVAVDEIQVPYRVAGTTLTIRNLTGRGPGWELTGRGRVQPGGPLEVRLHGRRRGEPVEGLLAGSLSSPRLVLLRGSF